MNGRHGELKSLALIIILLVSAISISYIVNDFKEQNNLNDTKSWWDESWARCKVITVTNPVANYQMALNVTYDSDMLTNFSDLRFIGSDNKTALNYWIEYKIDSAYAIVWVKLYDTNTSINMYYGNSTATSGSNGTNTWDYFLDWSTNKSSLFTQYYQNPSYDSIRYASLGLPFNLTAANGFRLLHYSVNTYRNLANYGTGCGIFLLDAGGESRRESSDCIGNMLFVDGRSTPQAAVSLFCYKNFSLSGEQNATTYFIDTSYHTYDVSVTSSKVTAKICLGSSKGEVKQWLNCTQNITLMNLTTIGYESGYQEKATHTGVDYWEYKSANGSIQWGASHPTRPGWLKQENKWVAIGKYVVTEPTGSFSNEQIGSAKWYNSNWLYCKKITIDHTKVAANLTNFPVLLSNTSADFRRAQSTGNDFIFLDAINTTKYNHEIETFNSTTGELVAWINITYLSCINDTIIYLYYGNPSCSNQRNVNGTWDSNYMAVQHLKDTTTSTTADSTANAVGGTKYEANGPIEAIGKIGKAQDFDGVNDYVNFGTGLIMTGSGTISFWLYYQNAGYNSGVRVILSKRAAADAAPANYQFFIHEGEGGALYGYNGVSGSTIGSHIPHNTWTYVTIARTSSTNMSLYYDGVYNAKWAWDWGTTTTHIVYIGGNSWSWQGQPYTYSTDCLMDEVRFSNSTRTDAWITTEFNNQNSSSTFMTLGNEQTNWYNTTWLYRQKITIDHNKLDSDLTNFPVLVKTTMNISRVQSDGDDLLFTSSGGTKLNHEIESYNSTSGELVSWVNVTYVNGGSSTPDTYIYLYYGNTTCSSQQNATGTWDSNYIIVNHFAETSGTNIVDSTSKYHNGTTYGSPALNQTGLFGKAISLDGSNDYIDYGDHDDFSPSAQTVEFILKAGTQTKTSAFLFSKEDISAGYRGAEYRVLFESYIQYDLKGTGGGWIARADNNGVATIGTTNWGHLANTWNGGTTSAAIDIYINGSVVDDQGSDGTFTAKQNTDYHLLLGSDNYIPANYVWVGSIDEFRFSSVARTSQWLSTEYKNMNDPANFTIFSAEEQYQTTGSNTQPNTPTNLGPSTRQIAPSVTIYAAATDPESDAITMYFYNNATKDEIGHQAGASGSNISVSWSGLSQGTSYSFYAKAYDSALWSSNSSICTFTTNAPPVISGLMTENLTDPNRITSFIPYFNWTYADNDTDTQQKYQIQVGTTQNGSNLWDSGNVTSASTNVKYGGTSLSRSTLYYIRIRTYDGYEWTTW